MESDEVKEGVEAAWDFWLSQHPISVPEIIESAVQAAFTRWLADHHEEVLERIAPSHKAHVVAHLPFHDHDLWCCSMHAEAAKDK